MAPGRALPPRRARVRRLRPTCRPRSSRRPRVRVRVRMRRARPRRLRRPVPTTRRPSRPRPTREL
ncbi:hypothetical protein CIW52_06250 [Mycolicibacterium sp. P9-64]|nr:hypothetical protein CIW52_06250 [Mycolicibacterium sp. P9-64]